MKKRTKEQLKMRGFSICLALVLAMAMLLSLNMNVFAEEVLPEEYLLTDGSDEVTIEEQQPDETEPEGSIVVLEAQEAAKNAEEEGLDYNGFIVSLKADAVSEQEIEEADKCEPVEYTESLCYADSVEDVLEDFSIEQIENIEPNYVLSLFDAEEAVQLQEEAENEDVSGETLLSSRLPNDPAYQNGLQTNLSIINWEAAWDCGLDGNVAEGEDPVVVAMIDTGVNLSHEDLTAGSIVGGHRWHSDDEEDIVDWHGHGSLSSSELVACTDNGIGVAGIVPQVKIMPLSIFYQYKKSDTTYVGADIKDLISAIDYAVENGADVINMSLGDKKISENLQIACDNAEAAGVILIAAAGNEGINSPEYPASFDNVIGVGSIGTSDDPYLVSTTSERGMDNVFCVAPGFRIRGMGYQTSSSYATKSGTSFSSPEVAALAALVKSIDRNITQSEFMQLLIDTCTDLGEAGRDDDYGYGLISFADVIKETVQFTMSLDVSAVELPAKKTCSINANVTSDVAGVPSVTWSSSDEKIATVDQNGLVTALRYGKADIIASLAYVPGISAKCRVQTRFSDVTDSTKYYYKPVYWAADSGITNGNDGVYFSPDSGCTRKQMMIFLWRLAGCPKVKGEMTFPDVTYGKQSASYKAILWGCTTGIVCGNSKGMFKPNDPVSRKQTAIMLYRLAGSPVVKGEMKFTDVEAAEKTATYRAILWGEQKSLINGYADNTFRPDEKCLRKQIVTILYRYQRH